MTEQLHYLSTFSLSVKWGTNNGVMIMTECVNIYKVFHVVLTTDITM